MMEAGEEPPAGCCLPENCILTEFQQLPAEQYGGLWSWMSELLGFESVGLPIAAKLIEEWPLGQLRAFVVFRGTVAAIEKERADQEAKWRAETRS